MAPDERVPDTGIYLPTVASEDCSIKEESNAEPLDMSPPKSSENHVALEHRSAPVRKPRMEVLKEKLKDRLKEKLKPKLRLSYFKHRQRSNSQVATPNAIATSKMLPASVKMEPEDDAPSELTGQLVVATNGRKKAGNKVSSPMSRVNRFADSILEFVGEKSVPEKVIRGALGNNPDISKAIRLLLSEKKLKRLGDGGKGCAYVYVRMDQAEVKPKARELSLVEMTTQAKAQRAIIENVLGMRRTHQAEVKPKARELSPVEVNTQPNTQRAIIERGFVREYERRFPATNVMDWSGLERMQGDQLQCDV